jgi:hypothetical protein
MDYGNELSGTPLFYHSLSDLIALQGLGVFR